MNVHECRWIWMNEADERQWKSQERNRSIRAVKVGFGRLATPHFFTSWGKKCASPWNALFPRFALTDLTHLTTLLLTFTLSIHPLSVETLRATSPFGYVRDACNVSVWIVSGCVGDVGRWWNRERPGTLCSCMIDDELGLRIHLLLSRPIVGNASRWVGSRQSTSLCVIYNN